MLLSHFVTDKKIRELAEIEATQTALEPSIEATKGLAQRPNPPPEAQGALEQRPGRRGKICDPVAIPPMMRVGGRRAAVVSFYEAIAAELPRLRKAAHIVRGPR